jgi:nucleoside-diphosphate-sugar epimerase
MKNNYSKILLKPLSKKKIILTGVEGYIGSELANQFNLNKIKYLGIDKRKSKNSSHLRLNLRSKFSFKRINNLQPDIFIHAGTHSAEAYNKNLNDNFQDDYLSLLEVFKILQNRPNCKLIYFSSSYVYSGLKNDKKALEETILNPEHNFGLAKLFFEELISRTHPNTVIFRLSSVFGGKNSIHPNFINKISLEALKSQEIQIWGKGKRKMQYIYIEEAVKIILKSFSLKPGIYNLGGNEYDSVLKTAEQIADFFGSKLIFLDDKIEGYTLPKMDNSKLLSSLKGVLKSSQQKYLSEYLKTLNKDLL